LREKAFMKSLESNLSLPVWAEPFPESARKHSSPFRLPAQGLALVEIEFMKER
jgi:hypothetical protein